MLSNLYRYKHEIRASRSRENILAAITALTARDRSLTLREISENSFCVEYAISTGLGMRPSVTVTVNDNGTCADCIFSAELCKPERLIMRIMAAVLPVIFGLTVLRYLPYNYLILFAIIFFSLSVIFRIETEVLIRKLENCCK